MKKHGRVLWFSSRKGYGFVEDDSGEKFFAHYKNIIPPEYEPFAYRALAPGREVLFNIKDSSTRKTMAVDIEQLPVTL